MIAYSSSGAPIIQPTYIPMACELTIQMPWPKLATIHAEFADGKFYWQCVCRAGHKFRFDSLDLDCEPTCPECAPIPLTVERKSNERLV